MLKCLNSLAGFCALGLAAEINILNVSVANGYLSDSAALLRESTSSVMALLACPLFIGWENTAEELSNDQKHN